MKHIIAACVLISGCGSELLAVSPTEQAKWEIDLDAYSEGIRVGHIDLFHQVSQQDFDAELSTLRGALPLLSETEIVARLMRLTHSLGDGHTAIPLWGAGYYRFPIAVRWVGGQALITASSSESRELLGARIISWDGHPIEDVYETLAPYVPFVENAHSEAVRVGQYISVAELVHAIGLTDNADTAVLVVEKDGVRSSMQLLAVDSDVYQATVTEELSYRGNLAEISGVIETEGVQFVSLDEGQLGYIRFDTYPSEEDMRSFADSVYNALERDNTANLVIDFRESFGGNYFIGLQLAADLVAVDGLNWRDGIYVLTSGITFSAAMSNAAQFSDILNARRVGEPSGANPCGYQDMGQFNLPQSGLLITYSKRRYCFSESVEGALQPDIRIDIEPDDYLANRDRALEWVRADIAGRAGE